MRIKLLNILLLLAIACLTAFSQEETSRKQKKMNGDFKEPIVLPKVVVDGDTLLQVSMAPITVEDQRVFKNRREERRYWRMVRNVKEVYPYAKMAGEKLREYEKELEGVNSKWKRKRIMKKVEKELIAEYEGDLRELTVTQGRILLRLIDRETGETSYELVEELRGKLSAYFWQSLAKLFDHDLKEPYDPEGQDEMIEDIVVKIERGEL